MRLSRLMVLVITTLALIFAVFFPNELVNLLILGYDGVCQFFPGVVLGLFWPKVTKAGVFSGIIVGTGIVIFLLLSHQDPFLGMNAGFIGLVVNSIITVSISLMQKPVNIKIDQPAV